MIRESLLHLVSLYDRWNEKHGLFPGNPERLKEVKAQTGYPGTHDYVWSVLVSESGRDPKQVAAAFNYTFTGDTETPWYRIKTEGDEIGKITITDENISPLGTLAEVLSSATLNSKNGMLPYSFRRWVGPALVFMCGLAGCGIETSSTPYWERFTRRGEWI